MGFKLEGRLNTTSSWIQISQGDLPWKNATNFPRNSVLGVGISSTYNSGDNSKKFTEVSFHTYDFDEYVEYKITWTATRNPTQLSLQLAEIEVRGFLGEEAGMPTLGYDGEYVPSVVIGSADIKVVGGYSYGAFYDRQAFDLSTHKFEMYRDSLSVTPGSCMLVMIVISLLPLLSSLISLCPIIRVGVIVSPTHGWMSVVTGLRVFMANNNPDADPVKYRILGSIMSGANVNNIVDDLCWSVSDDGLLLGNAICSINDPHQKFFMNELGEIRVKSHPGWCLDPTYAIRNSYEFRTAMFVPCFSEDPDNTENTGKSSCAQNAISNTNFIHSQHVLSLLMLCFNQLSTNLLQIQSQDS
jgi:hypothetical protein